MIRLSILIPTVGRPTLARTLGALDAAGLDRQVDEILMVGDGPSEEARRIGAQFKDLGMLIVYTENPRLGHAGHPQRNFAMGLATGTHLLSIDDDDAHTPGALTTIRKALSEKPDRVHIFRMRARSSRLPYDVLWRTPALVEGNLGTPMFVVPNVRARLGTWGNRYAGDFDFIQSTVQSYPERDDCVVWHEDIVADIY